MKRTYIYLIFSGFLLLLNGQFSMASDIPNQYIVVFKDQQLTGRAKFTIAASGESVRSASERLINETNINQALIQNSSGARSSFNKLGFVYEYALKGFSAQLTPEAADYISNQPEVDYVTPDQTLEFEAVQVNPPSWGLDRIDQEDRPLDQSYEYRTYGTGVHAYVIDTGIRASHHEFIRRIGNGYDVVGDDDTPVDCIGHGSHVAGTLGGSDYGVAKNVTIHAVRISNCSDSNHSNLIMGINWLLQNLQLPAVVNMSVGGRANNAVDAAVNNLINAGAVAIVAAGNEGTDACNVSPARVENAITVSASTPSDSRLFFPYGAANRGPCVDIFAPGSDITSAWWNSDTALRTISGTSMAAPHVAGVAALYLEKNPTATPAEVAEAIITNSTKDRLSNIGTDTPNRLLYGLLTESSLAPWAWLVPVINHAPF